MPFALPSLELAQANGELLDGAHDGLHGDDGHNDSACFLKADKHARFPLPCY
jgi:hypothetical protein